MKVSTRHSQPGRTGAPSCTNNRSHDFGSTPSTTGVPVWKRMNGWGHKIGMGKAPWHGCKRVAREECGHWERSLYFLHFTIVVCMRQGCCRGVCLRHMPSSMMLRAIHCKAVDLKCVLTFFVATKIGAQEHILPQSFLGGPTRYWAVQDFTRSLLACNILCFPQGEQRVWTREKIKFCCVKCSRLTCW